MAFSRSAMTGSGSAGRRIGQNKSGKASTESLMGTKPQKLSRPSDKLNPKTVDPVSIHNTRVHLTTFDYCTHSACLTDSIVHKC